MAGEILRINQKNMEQAEPRRAAAGPHRPCSGTASALAVGIGLAVLLIGSTIRTILYPIRAVTESAPAIGAGNLDQMVPMASDDELGQLATPST